jgi:predicted nucleotidyltransferase
MKTKITILCLLCACFCSPFLKAQTFSPGVLNNYSASVVAKVYDVYSKLALGEQKQLLLAGLYKQEDSLLLDAAQKNKPSLEIERIRYQIREKMQDVLSQAEFENYLKTTVATSAHLQAIATVAAMKQFMDIDSTHQNYLISNRYLKLLDTEITMQKYRNNPSLMEKLSVVNS